MKTNLAASKCDILFCSIQCNVSIYWRLCILMYDVWSAIDQIQGRSTASPEMLEIDKLETRGSKLVSWSLACNVVS